MNKFLYLLFLQLAVAWVNVRGAGPVLPPKYTVKGVVVSVDGGPLAGATISVEGTNINTGTNAKGEFAIDFQKDRVYSLRVSFVGYVTRRITVPSSGHPPLIIR